MSGSVKCVPFIGRVYQDCFSLGTNGSFEDIEPGYELLVSRQNPGYTIMIFDIVDKLWEVGCEYDDLIFSIEYRLQHYV